MQLLKFMPVAAAVLTLAACSSVNTKLVHDTVLPEYSPAANMGDVLDVWAACKKGTQKWTEIKEDGKPVVVQFECSAQDLVDLNNTILENSRTIKRMRELFEFDDIKYRAQFVVKSDGSGFDLGGQYKRLRLAGRQEGYARSRIPEACLRRQSCNRSPAVHRQPRKAVVYRGKLCADPRPVLSGDASGSLVQSDLPIPQTRDFQVSGFTIRQIVFQ